MKYCCLEVFRKEYFRLSLNSENRKEKHLNIGIVGYSKNKNHLMGLGQNDSLGEYCDPHTASSVFLISIC